jgi:hypothetical protein
MPIGMVIMVVVMPASIVVMTVIDVHVTAGQTAGPQDRNHQH